MHVIFNKALFDTASESEQSTIARLSRWQIFKVTLQCG